MTEPITPAPAVPASLYQRLGGYDAIAALGDDFMRRLLGDPQVSRHFSGHDDESRARIRQHVVLRLCAAAGGPCVSVGRDTKSAMSGIGVGEADWTATVGHLIASLNLFKVGAKEKEEVLTFVGSLKKDIVEKP